MNNFGTLYYYEVKKILGRKLTWIVFLICICGVVLFSVVDLTGKYYVDGEIADTHYHMFRVDQEYQRALSGRKLDQTLLEEMSAGYKKLPAGEERYMLTDEYQTYARPYSEIFNLVRLWTQRTDIDKLKAWEPDEEALYAARLANIEKEWQDYRLSDMEKTYWREKEAQTKRPITYIYNAGYRKLISNGINTIGLQVLLFASICLSSVFAEEHARRTDQLILSGAKGKSTVYWAKLAAGTSVSVVCAILMSALAFGIVFAVYGAEGFHASVRLVSYLWMSSCTLTSGQVCLIAYGVLVLTAVFVSVLVLVLSEALHNNIATLAVCVGLLMVGMFARIPCQYRVLAQIWDWLPMRFLNAEFIFDIRTLPVFGHCFTAFAAVPVLYVFTGIAAAVAGKKIYRNYQVSGR